MPTFDDLLGIPAGSHFAVFLSSGTITMKAMRQASREGGKMRCSRFIALLALLLVATACAPQEPKVKVTYEDNAQFELVSPQGVRVLIDIANPGKLTSPATDKDILLTTHIDFDHYNSQFVESFPGQQLWMKEGEIKQVDVAIKGVKAAHYNATPPDGSDYIYVVDMGGLRIAHFGDLGQEKLTQDQLDQLGAVDVALSQLENPYSAVTLDNKKGFNQMEQVKPKLLIPTHGNSNMEAVKYALGGGERAPGV